MNSVSIKEYLRHYGKIRTLRGSVIRSTFRRVTAAFDDYDADAVEKAMRELKLDPDRLNCVYCGESATCWDHLVPAARDGTHQLGNLAPACTVCNNRKGGKTWSEFFETLRNEEATEARRKVVETYATFYRPGQSLIDNPEDQRALDCILDRIHQAMTEADELIAKAIAKRGRVDPHIGGA